MAAVHGGWLSVSRTKNAENAKEQENHIRKGQTRATEYAKNKQCNIAA
jgi:hypothetical protein